LVHTPNPISQNGKRQKFLPETRENTEKIDKIEAFCAAIANTQRSQILTEILDLVK
jgi:hypothetical protein